MLSYIRNYDGYDVRFKEQRVGIFVEDVDGYYKFCPYFSNGGYWDKDILQDLVNKEFELNKDWDEQVKFDNE